MSFTLPAAYIKIGQAIVLVFYQIDPFLTIVA